MYWTILRKKQETTITLFNAVIWLHKAWHQVTPKCIQNCFRKAGFFIPAISSTDEIVDHSEHDSDNDDLSLAELADLRRKTCDYRNSDIDNHIEPSDYVCWDLQVISTETPTDDDVVDKIQGEIEDEDGAETDKVGEEIDASADTKETHEISAQDALKAITTLQTFFMQKSYTSDLTFSVLQNKMNLLKLIKKIRKNNCLSRSLHKHRLCYF